MTRTAGVVAAATAFASLSLALFLFPACAVRASTPERMPKDASSGRAPPHFDAARACGHWREAAGSEDPTALSHASFPELDPKSCFVPVRYGPRGPEADPTPPGCGYPASEGTVAHLRDEAARYLRIADGTAGEEPLPLELACPLDASDRAVTARTNAATLLALAHRLERGKRFPYALAGAFGLGTPGHDRSRLLSWRPGQPCPAIGKEDMDVLGTTNVLRAYRAADAYLHGVAPVVTVSGGHVHSSLTEAFLLDFVLTCRAGVRRDAVLLDPCADHTHTNLRNTAALLARLGGRTAYVVTDDGLQSGYLREWTLFDLMGGSLDQRSLRDFGYLTGSWRQASVGMGAGYWFTPYRFWAEPQTGLGSFSCEK